MRPLHRLPPPLFEFFHEETFDAIMNFGSVLIETSKSTIEILSQNEELYGLQSVFIEGSLPSEEWLGLIAQGKIPVDIHQDRQPILTFTSRHNSEMSQAIQIAKNHWRHLALTHRFQIYLLLRDSESQPELYGLKGDVAQRRQKVAQFIRQLGDAGLLL